VTAKRRDLFLLTDLGAGVFHAFMQIKQLGVGLKIDRAQRRVATGVLPGSLMAALVLSLVSIGCSISPLAKHTAAFSAAACLVVDNSSNAYRAAVNLHEEEQASAGILKFEEGVAWDPHNDKPLISPEGLETRLQVLASLKTYAQSLSDVTSGLDSPALDKASASVGSNLQGLSVSFASEQGPAASGLAMGTQTANEVSTAARALGEYLIEKKVKAAVPSITRKMDPSVEALCKLLMDDIAILRTQAKKDYEDLFRQQEVLIKKDLKTGGARDEIAKLPQILREERATDDMLSDLQTAIARLAMTHHALAAAAQGNNPEALRVRIADLMAAGQNLGKYYQGLPTK